MFEVGQKYRLDNVDAMYLNPEFNNGEFVVITMIKKHGDDVYGIFMDDWGKPFWSLSTEFVVKGYATLITEDETNSRPSTDLEKFLIQEIFFLLVENSVEFKDGDFGAMMIDTFSDDMKQEVVVNYLTMLKEQNE